MTVSLTQSVRQDGSSTREQALVRFDDVTLTVEGRTFLRNFDLSIYPGDSIVIAGPPGCGKSFIPRLILGLPGIGRESVVVEGEVTVAGRSVACDMQTTELQKLRRQIGTILRGGGLIENMDVRRNITLPLNYHYRDVIGPVEINARCDLLLEDMGLSALGKSGRRPVNLNREERHYVSLARALITDPILLVMDEPTSGLSPMSTQRLANFLFHYQPQFSSHPVVDARADFPLTRLVTSVDLTRYLGYGTQFAVIKDQRVEMIGNRQDTSESSDPMVRELLTPYGSMTVAESATVAAVSDPIT